MRRTGEIMVTGGMGEESSVLLLSGDMWIKRNPLPQRVAPNHSLSQVQNSIYLVDTKVSFITTCIAKNVWKIKKFANFWVLVCE